MAGATSLFLCLFFPEISLAMGERIAPIGNIERYFPDEVGMTWTYQGTIADDVMRIATYTNVSTVSGLAKKNGVSVKVFQETNQANEGPSESYFLMDAKGIDYHGGEPTTEFENQLIPYRIIQFDLALHQPFSQLNKRGISFGRDYDQDGIDEMADVYAEITAEGFETVSVPAGVFNNALKMKGLMVIRLTLSDSGEVVHIIDRTHTWFALDVGTVKGVESIEFPQFEGLPPLSTVITESLSAFSGQPDQKQ